MSYELRDLSDGMIGEDVQFLHDELQKLGYQIPPDEKEKNFFGPGTHKAVLEFQKLQGLKITGVVNEITAESIKAQFFIVHGEVRQADGLPLASGIVRVVDKDLRGEQEVGKSETDKKGRYRIEYISSQYSRAEKGHADLIVRVYNENNALLTESDIVFNSGHDETINLIIGGGKYRGQSEYEQLLQDLEPLLMNVTVDNNLKPTIIEKLAVLKVEGNGPKENEVEFLAKETGISPAQITDIVTSARLNQETKIPAAVFYGFFHQNLPRSLPELLAQNWNVLRRALEKTIADNIIPLRLQDSLDKIIQQLQNLNIEIAFMKSDIPGKYSIGEILGETDLSVKFQKELLDLSIKHEGPIQDFWEKLRKDPNYGEDKVNDIQFTLHLGVLTQNHLPLLKQIKSLKQNDKPITSLRDLTHLDVADWEQLIMSKPDGQVVGTPPDIPGDDIKQKVRNYANTIIQMIDKAFPTDMIERKIKHDTIEGKDDLIEFFKNNKQQFDLSSTYIDRYVRDNKNTAFAGVNDADSLVRQLKRWQRVLRIAPSLEPYEAMRVLLAEGLDSAQSVAKMGANAFVRRYADKVGGKERAKEIHRKSRHRYALAVTLFGKYGAPFYSLPVIGEWISQMDDIPNWNELFGSSALCETEHCRSNYSPAAYFADILNWIKTDVDSTDPSRTGLDVLLERRPDLSEIELSCENTNTPVPYVDLVNEILETATAPLIIDNFPSGNLDEIRRIFEDKGFKLSEDARVSIINPGTKWRIIDKGMRYIVELEGSKFLVTIIPQTAAASEEQPTNPEHINVAAYEKLILEVYPWTLPFNLWAEEARVYLDHLNVPRYQLMETFYRETPPAFLNDTAIVTEHLHMTSSEREIIAGVKATTIDRVASLSGLQIIDGLALEQGDRVLVKDQPIAALNGIYVVHNDEWTLLDEMATNTGVLIRVQKGTINRDTYWRFTHSTGVASKSGPWELWGLDESVNNVPDPIDPAVPNATGNWEIVLKRISILLQRSGLTYKELLELLDTSFINPARLLFIESNDPEKPATCNVSRLEIVGADIGIYLGKIHRFVRLQRKLGWSILELDRTLTALGTEDIDESFLVKLSHIKRLQAELKVPLINMLSWWSKLDTASYYTEKESRVKPLYEQLFLNKTLLNPEDLVFQLNDMRNELADPFKGDAPDPNTIRKHAPAVLAALQISENDLTLLLTEDQVPDQLNLATLSHLYRITSFSKALHISIPEFISLKSLSGIDSFDPLKTTENTIVFADKVHRIHSSGFTFKELDYLLRHNYENSMGIAPTEERIGQVLRDLRDGLRKIKEETKTETDPTGEITRKWLTFLKWSENQITQAIATLNGTAVYEAHLTDLPEDIHFDGLTAELKNKVSYDLETKKLRFIGPMKMNERAILEGLSDAHTPAYLEAILLLFNAPRNFLQEEMKAFVMPTFSAHLIFDHFPSGIIFPDSLKERMYYDAGAEELRLVGVMTQKEKESVLTLSTDHDYQNAIEELFGAFDAYIPEMKNHFLIDADSLELFNPDVSVEKRFSYVLAKLMTYIRTRQNENLVIHTIADAMSIEEQVMEKLLNQQVDLSVHPEKKAIEEFLAEDFSGSNPDVESTAAAFPDQFKTYTILHKISTFISRLDITAWEIEWLFEHGSGMDWSELKTLPLIPPAESPSEAERLTERNIWKGWFETWERMLSFFQLRDSLSAGKPQLFDVIGEALKIFTDTTSKNTAKEAYLKGLSQRTTWPMHDLESLLGQKNDHEQRGILGAIFPDSYKDERLLVRLAACFKTMKQLGISATRIVAWCNADLTADSARSIKQAVKAKYDEKRWNEVAKPLRNALREKQRSALVSHLVAENGLANSNGLYQYLLIDPEMSPCMMTSRIKQAISTVQLFIQRSLMGLEPEVSPNQDNVREWEWRKNYRVWEANRKVFLYPENWIEPELRDNKSPFFKDMENELLQNDITSETAEAAYMHYLEKLDEVARLEISGIYHQKEDDADGEVDILHVFGRTRNTPHIYYYRRWINSRDWTAWERVDLDIEGDHLIPAVWNRRVYLFWPIFTENAKADSSFGDSGEAPQKYWEIKLAWSEYGSGKWSAKKVSDKLMGTDPALNLLKENFFFSIHKRNFYPNFIDDLYITFSWNNNPLPETGRRYSYKTFLLINSNRILEVPDSFAIFLSHGILPTGSFLKYMKIEESSGGQKLEIPRFTTGFVVYEPVILDTPSTYNIVYQHQIYLSSRYFDNAFFYEDNERTFFVTTYYQRPSDSFVKGRAVRGKNIYQFHTFYHPYVNIFMRELNRYGIDGFLNSNANSNDRIVRRLYRQEIENKYFETYKPQDNVQKPHPKDNIDFEGGAYSLYNWELFFHGPLLIADRLSKNQRFEEAQKWFHYIFNPTASFDPTTSISGLRGTYFNNVSLGGPASLTRVDSSIDFNWGGGSPDPTIHSDNFSVRWTGKVRPQYTGLYTFYAKIDDGVRLWVDNQLIIDQWDIHHDTEYAGSINLQASKFYDIKMDYFESGGDAVAQLRWEGPHTSKEIIPSSRLYTAMPYWKVRPLVNDTNGSQRIETLMQLLNEGDELMEQQVADWEDDPFNPHLIARLRLIAYQKTVVMKYIDNLIAWGDQIFRQNSIESMNEATQLYILAAEILGPRPNMIPPRGITSSKAYSELKDLDELTNALVGIEHLVLSDTEPVPGPDRAVPNILYFNIPKNDKLLSYWNTVEDRLLKIRHCMNIEGVVQELPLFEPPIDPGLLVRARAAGVDIRSALSDINTALPQYRFQIMLQKAVDLCADVRNLGSTLLATMEKRDSEALALLRSRQELQVMDAIHAVKVMQVKEAEESLGSLHKSYDMTQIRHKYYMNIEFMNKWEITQNYLMELSFLSQSIGWLVEITAGGAHANPDLKAGTAGMCSPIVIVEHGGTHVGNAADSWAKAFQGAAAILNTRANMSATMGGYWRRADEWKLQENLAKKELEQINKQIIAAELRLNIAQKELINHELQTNNTKEIDDFMRDKYTNQELYNWMVSQISTLYFQSYHLAYDLAKRAERAYQYELGSEDSNFIQFGYWDNLKKGLLSGEKLNHDLKRMEAAYLEKNRRELEITKHISLQQLDPYALLQLKTTGSCEITILEWLFDLDCPGHYMRRIKTVSLSIPCVAGPYTSINCKLSLLKSTIRTSPDGEYKDYFGTIQSIVTSNAQNDSGLFETNLRDERYLPFEGAGTESKWKLELPGEFQQFDYNTISDVILHLRYTARDGGDRLKTEAITKINIIVKSATTSVLARSFSLKHDFPTEWHRFISSTENENLKIIIKKDHFPYIAQGFNINISKILLFAVKDKDLMPRVIGPVSLSDVNDETKKNQSELSIPFIASDKDVLIRNKDVQVFLVLSYSLGG